MTIKKNDEEAVELQENAPSTYENCQILDEFS